MSIPKNLRLIKFECINCDTQMDLMMEDKDWGDRCLWCPNCGTICIDYGGEIIANDKNDWNIPKSEISEDNREST